MKVRPIRCAAALGLVAPLVLAGSAAALAHASAEPHASSPYLAGYTSQVQGSGSIERITVPSFTCPPNADTRVAFGIADQGPNDTQPVVRTAVDAICDVEGGIVEYGTEVTVPGQSVVSSQARPGDLLTFRITYGKHHSVFASVIDQSHPRASITLTGTAPQAALHFGALPMVEGDSSLLPAPDFGQVDVLGAIAAGHAITGRSTLRYKRVDDGQTTITASGFQPRDSGSFTLVATPN
jgi:hypothetical protein